MAVYDYRTIAASAQGIYKEKGSKFIALAFPVETEDDARLHLNHVKKEYFDARHHCYAYILGADRKKFRAFDDGEPNHSAGDPILGQLRSRDLTNVLVIVIRYFGGVKLGVSGLIGAYRAAAEDVLNHCQVIVKEITGSVVITYSYENTPEVMKLVKTFDLTVVEQKFEERCSLRAEFPLKKESALAEKLNVMMQMGTILNIER